MHEVLPGLFHWTATHPKIHVLVDSYWLDDSGVLIDPLVPPDLGMDWFASRRAPPSAIVLTIRHHYRHSGEIAAAFGCPIYCNAAGLHEFSHDEPVSGFGVGAELPGGLVACDVDAICPDETALHLPGLRALFMADGVVHGGPRDQDGPLGFVPDSLMDDPAETKRGLLDACSRMLGTLDFEHLLLAHGEPLIGNGRERLQELVDSGGRTAFEM